jgi:diacylglycerol kinase (ATP)
VRILFAFKNSGKGFQWLLKNEAAFQQELVLAVLLVPLSFSINETLSELLLLLMTLALVLIVEIFNTAIETVVDRIGLEHHELSGLAKDLGSAAVLLSLLFAAGGLAHFFMALWIGVIRHVIKSIDNPD